MKKTLTRSMAVSAFAIVFAVSAGESNQTKSPENQCTTGISKASHNIAASSENTPSNIEKCENAMKDCQKAIESMQKKADDARQKGDVQLANAFSKCVSAKQKLLNGFKAIRDADNACFNALSSIEKCGGMDDKITKIVGDKTKQIPGMFLTEKKCKTLEKIAGSKATQAEKKGEADLAVKYKQLVSCIQKKMQCMTDFEESRKACASANKDLAGVKMSRMSKGTVKPENSQVASSAS